MLKNNRVAKKVLAELENASGLLNRSLFVAQDGNCDADSYARYKKLVGFAMGYLYTDLIRPIHKEHPELEPEELKRGD